MPSTDLALLADIGGTHARFALLDKGAVTHIETMRADTYDSAAAAATAYLSAHKAAPVRAVLAVAGPVHAGEDAIELVNHRDWNFSQKDFKTSCGIDDLLVVNDFEALAHGVPYLPRESLMQVGGGPAVDGAPIAVIGPGTGLGVAGIVFKDKAPQVIASEGGNVTLPVAGPREFAIAEAIRSARKDGHVSVENAVSGIGLVNLYNAIITVDGLQLPHRQAAAIASAALNGTCAASAEAVDLFCHFLGVAAGNLALTLGAFGGVYIGGGIVPQWPAHFAASRFRKSFEDKGDYRGYVARIPAFVILHPAPAFEGLKRLAGA